MVEELSLWSNVFFSTYLIYMHEGKIKNTYFLEEKKKLLSLPEQTYGLKEQMTGMELYTFSQNFNP